MPKRNVQLVNGEFYHIVKRGVEGREIFIDEEDHIRFINSLLIFNDRNPAPWNMRSFWLQRDPASLKSLKDYFPKNPLVEIHAFALVKNHFHILIRQVLDNGTSDFMEKLGGYAYYFNKKYNRVGPLFQGRFKAVLIKDDQQLKNTFAYINTNPLAVIKPKWKEEGIGDFQKAANFLGEYKWSGYLDYLGQENFSNVINKDFFLELLSGANGCREITEDWIKYKEGMSNQKSIYIE